MHDLIAPDIIDLNLVQEMFKAADLDTEQDEDGDLVVESPEDDWTTVIVLDKERSFIVMRAYATFTDEASEIDKLRLVDELNRGTILVRFYTDENIVLVSDAMLSYEGGITAFQVLRTWRWFLDVGRAAISEFDEQDIVE